MAGSPLRILGASVSEVPSRLTSIVSDVLPLEVRVLTTNQLNTVVVRVRSIGKVPVAQYPPPYTSYLGLIPL